MKKYIVKNCSSIAADNHNNPFCFNVNVSNKEQKLCKDCTDCVMKQIVELCKMSMSNNNFKYILEHKNDEGIIWLSDSAKAILNILRLLEIEEVDEE